MCIVLLLLICYNYLNIPKGGSVLNKQLVASLLLNWYSAHFRPLPWRSEPTPYHVWVSEIMLQQTRIEAVLPYYRRFIDALPTVEDLAHAPSELLLKLWEGLGYYSRVKNMQKAAQKIVNDFGGVIPSDYDVLLTLPGIGPYTAGAISSIAYNRPAAAVDGNVMRVLARLTADDTDVLSNDGKKRFTALAWELVPAYESGRFNQAIMELGETVCLPNGVPHCAECPLRDECEAHRQGVEQQLPVRIKKTKRRVEHRQVALVCVDTYPRSVLLHKRSGEGLLADLWELPNTLDKDPLASLPIELRDCCLHGGDLPETKHLFSHIEWRMNGAMYHVDSVDGLPEDFALADLAALQTAFPLPSAFRAYAALLPQLLDEEC